MITWIICVSPGLTKPVLGFTQYFFGAVVFTLNAVSSFPEFVILIELGIVFLSSTASVDRGTGGVRDRSVARRERLFSLGGPNERDARAGRRRRGPLASTAARGGGVGARTSKREFLLRGDLQSVRHRASLARSFAPFPSLFFLPVRRAT